MAWNRATMLSTFSSRPAIRVSAARFARSAGMPRCTSSIRRSISARDPRLPFSGPLADQLSESVLVENEPVAVVESVANNSPPHLPMGGSFQTPPSNRAVVSSGSDTVFVENKAIARANDGARCCNDPSDSDTGHVLAGGSVSSG